VPYRPSRQFDVFGMFQHPCAAFRRDFFDSTESVSSEVLPLAVHHVIARRIIFLGVRESCVESHAPMVLGVAVAVFRGKHVIANSRKRPNKSRQINRRDVPSLDGFRRLGVLWFIHGLSCRSPAVPELCVRRNKWNWFHKIAAIPSSSIF
jgi:hypothetical protein